MNNSCEELLLTSLNNYFNNNVDKKYLLKTIISGQHKLSLRLIDWLVTHYSKANNIYYWIYKNNVYETYPEDVEDSKNLKKINLYLDYRAQLKSYAKINFDSFRRHQRITFFIDFDKEILFETTIGQLNFFRWAFSNNILEYAVAHYDKIYDHMIKNNVNKRQKKKKHYHTNIQDITRTRCTLRFD